MRDGLSQREIEQALRRANGWDDEAVSDGPIRRLWRVLGGRRSAEDEARDGSGSVRGRPA